MRYLGRITRAGALMPEGAESIPANFELECYAVKNGLIHGSGEITATPEAVRLFMEHSDVDFMTSDGHLLKLKLADRKTPPEGGFAHVVATGDLPIMKNGALDWAPAA